MAQRLSVVERARIEAMYMAGVSVLETARCLGRAPSTIYRECKRAGCSVRGYDAQLAQTAADARAARDRRFRALSLTRGSALRWRGVWGWVGHRTRCRQICVLWGSACVLRRSIGLPMTTAAAGV